MHYGGPTLSFWLLVACLRRERRRLSALLALSRPPAKSTASLRTAPFVAKRHASLPAAASRDGSRQLQPWCQFAGSAAQDSMASIISVSGRLQLRTARAGQSADAVRFICEPMFQCLRAEKHRERISCLSMKAPRSASCTCRPLPSRPSRSQPCSLFRRSFLLLRRRGTRRSSLFWRRGTRRCTLL